MKAIGTQMLQTERLILRRFVESDAEVMFQNWASSAKNLIYVTWDPHPDVEVTRNLRLVYLHIRHITNIKIDNFMN